MPPAVIDKQSDQQGGRGESRENGLSTDRDIHVSLLDDVAALRAQYEALLAKLDTDFTAQNIAVGSSQLDEDYASTVNAPVLGTTEGS